MHAKGSYNYIFNSHQTCVLLSTMQSLKLRFENRYYINKYYAWSLGFEKNGYRIQSAHLSK